VVGLVAFANERGESLVEILISVAIIAIVITAFLAALSTGAFSVALVRKQVTAENLARAQLEYIKDYAYSVTPYPTVEHSEEDYLITIGVSYWNSSAGTFTSDPLDDSGMQWITVTVSQNGEPVFTIEDYKVNR
jgi:type II secretory pathway pseudopilin PulG